MSDEPSTSDEKTREAFQRDGDDNTCMPAKPECANWLDANDFPTEEYTTVDAECICGAKLPGLEEAGKYVNEGTLLQTAANTAYHRLVSGGGSGSGSGSGSVTNSNRRRVDSEGGGDDDEAYGEAEDYSGDGEGVLDDDEEEDEDDEEDEDEDEVLSRR